MRKFIVRLGYLPIAAFILLAPAVPQIFGHSTGWIRAWIMYSGVGSGVLRGEFTLTQSDGTVAREAPQEFFGLTQYPLGQHVDFGGRVEADEDLLRIAEARCAELQPGSTLGFDGFRGTPKGWVPLSMADICGGGQ